MIGIKLCFQLLAKQNKLTFEIILEVLSFNFNLTYTPNHEDSLATLLIERVHRLVRTSISNGNTAIFDINPDST